jgi:hypothetical protein
MSEEFWLDEQVAPQSADPLFQLMLERGELDDDDEDAEDVRLGVRQQAMLSAWINDAYSHDLEASEDTTAERVSKCLSNAVRRSAKYLSLQIEQGKMTLSEAIERLTKFVDRDEAVTLLLGE